MSANAVHVDKSLELAGEPRFCVDAAPAPRKLLLAGPISSWMARWRGHRFVQAAVVVAFLLLLGTFLNRAYRKASRPGGYDVHCFLATARALRAGTNPYLVEMPIPYNYPLFASAAAIPLTFLPESVVHATWFLASLAAWAGAGCLIVNRLAPGTGVVRNLGRLLPFGCACLLLLGPIQNHLLNGQTDAFVLLLCVLFWIDWHEDRRQRSAFWLGLGVSLKLVPGLFIIPLLLTRSWSALAQTCFWVVLFSLALPALFLGGDIFGAHEYYIREVLLAELRTSAHSLRYPHCYTVHGALSWLAPAWQNSAIGRAGAALLVLMPLCVVEWTGRGSSPRQCFARLEAYLAGILLLAPLSQPHHLTLLLPAVWSLALRWTAGPGRTWAVELLEILPFALFPLWTVLGGPLEVLAVGWLFVSALCRTSGLGESKVAAEAMPVFAATQKFA